MAESTIHADRGWWCTKERESVSYVHCKRRFVVAIHARADILPVNPNVSPTLTATEA